MIARNPFTIAVSTLLAQASGFPVGRGRRPTGVNPPYYLLYSITTDLAGPELADLNEDLTVIYQVTAVSGPDPSRPNSYGVADQAEIMADKARTAFLGRDPVTGLWLHTLTVPGIKVYGRSLDTEPGGTNDPADAIMNYVQRFEFNLTPA
ncbi:hypothetical protein [Streptomyces sp. NPDC060366]|uniref:hypothetical protein n=1 Tax=Streptomyces sp. NPDC060366 TaxID=3347105 RepID=UPI003661AF35